TALDSSSTPIPTPSITHTTTGPSVGRNDGFTFKSQALMAGLLSKKRPNQRTQNVAVMVPSLVKRPASYRLAGRVSCGNPESRFPKHVEALRLPLDIFGTASPRFGVASPLLAWSFDKRAEV